MTSAVSTTSTGPIGLSMIREQAAEIFRAQQDRIAKETDRVFEGLMLLQWVAALGISLWMHNHMANVIDIALEGHFWTRPKIAALLGGAVTMFPILLVAIFPGRSATRYAIAVCQMAMSGVLIFLMGGRTETH